MLIPLFFCIFANLIVTSDESYSRLKKQTQRITLATRY